MIKKLKLKLYKITITTKESKWDDVCGDIYTENKQYHYIPETSIKNVKELFKNTYGKVKVEFIKEYK